MVPDGWIEEKLGNLFEFKNGANTEAANYGSGIKFVNVMDVFGNHFITSEKIRERVNLPEKKINLYLLKMGDVLFNRTSEVFDEIALTSVYMDTSPAIFGGFVIRGRPKASELDFEFCIYCFSSYRVRKESIRRGQGVIRSNIGQKDLQHVPLLIPPIIEQKKIAKILSTWDRAIEATEKLLNNSQQQKKSLMQQLLTGKKRLPEFKKNDGFIKTRYGLIPADWDFVHIEGVAKQVVQKNIHGLDLPVISCSKHDGFVDSLKYFNKKVYSDDTSGYKIIERGCFGFPSNHIEEGSIGYQNLYDAGIVSPIYTIFRPKPKKINSEYLFKLLKTEHYRQIFAASTNASVDRRGSLRWKDFSKIRVPLPALVEQQAIASVLSIADKEIETLQQKLNYLQQEKKALMQQLLTGKHRVKIDREAA